MIPRRSPSTTVSRLALFLALALLSMASRAAAPLVAVDVGHYLKNPGAISAAGTPEFVFNQRLARRLVQVLDMNQVRVQLVNEAGQLDSLTQRTEIAADAGLFVSIHHDSVRRKFLPVVDPRYSGFSVWVSRKNRASDKSIQCARTLGDSLRAAGFTPSSYHADPVIGENRPIIDLERGVFARDELAVLKTARSPAVLVEAGVIVNPADEPGLKDPERIARMASAIAAGIQGCLQAP